ncbi:MAG: hypothetical protein WA990_05650 [Rubrobacteraceae bacterium]
MRVQLGISPKFARQLALVLILIVAGLTVMSLTVNILFNYQLLDSASQTGGGDGGKLQLFELDSDQNIPTWYSSSMLLICAGLLAIIAAAARRNIYRIQWIGLSLIFLYLSADEAASIHEKMSPAVERLIPISGFSDYAWIFLYAPLVLIFALAYLGFLRALPAETKHLFILAGSLYVAGALGMEAIDGTYASIYGSSNVVYSLLTHIEEVLEMLGVVVFFYSLLLYISFYVREISVGPKGQFDTRSGD